MELKKTVTGTEAVIAIEGRLDTMTAPKLESEIKETVKDAERLVLDFEALEYISSAGLRVLLAAQKAMNAKKGAMVVRNVNEAVKEVFEITGFNEVLTIE